MTGESYCIFIILLRNPTLATIPPAASTLTKFFLGTYRETFAIATRPLPHRLALRRYNNNNTCDLSSFSNFHTHTQWIIGICHFPTRASVTVTAGWRQRAREK